MVFTDSVNVEPDRVGQHGFVNDLKDSLTVLDGVTDAVRGNRFGEGCDSEFQTILHGPRLFLRLLVQSPRMCNRVAVKRIIRPQTTGR